MTWLSDSASVVEQKVASKTVCPNGEPNFSINQDTPISGLNRVRYALQA